MNNSAVHEQAASLNYAGNLLQGTLTLPCDSENTNDSESSQPIIAALLLLPDSGPLDRNQNSIQVQLNIFNEIANSLAPKGIASLRYDKRGCGMSKGKFDTAGHSDLVADAQQWLDYLNTDPATQKAPIYILGHGEGSLIAAQLSAANTYVKGQILLTPFIEDYESVIRRQAENALEDIADLEGFRGKLIRFFVKLSGDQIAKQKKLIQKIRKSKRSTFKIRKQVINAKWIREMISLDAAAIHGSVTIPSLIIGGKKDLQCLPQDVEKIAAIVKGPVQSHVLDDLTHILRADPEKPSVRHYLQLTLQDVDKRVVDTISTWLAQQTKQTTL